jgi:hypothetical protein
MPLQLKPVLPTGAGGGAYLASFDGEEQRHGLIFGAWIPPQWGDFWPQTSAHLPDGAGTGSDFR